jgi:hypothetical protein
VLNYGALSVSLVELMWIIFAASLLGLLFPHLRTQKLLIFFPIIALTTLLTTLALGAQGTWTSYAYDNIDLAVERRLGPPLAWLATGATIIAITIGVFIARPVSRVIVRAFLRPELRGPFERLWLADGKALPNERSWGRPRRPRRTEI